ncbi:hypothetical protein KKA95_02990 [Patescibacteria group bacterium]|nr:hypothetical protein [Patescibacteria group bacterium]
MSAYKVRKSMMPLSKKIILKLSKEKVLDEKVVKKIRNELTKKGGGILPKNLELIAAYNELVKSKKLNQIMIY